MKQTVWVKAVIKTCRGFMTKHGQVGKDIVRFEWRNYARILQTQKRYRFRVKRIKFQALLRRVYREDDKAKENWSSILTRVPLERPVHVDSGDSSTQLETEYFASVITPHSNFAVDHTVGRPQEDGSEKRETQRDYFTVINVAHARRRPHLVHTVAAADETEHNAPFAMEVQLMERWYLPEGGGLDEVIRVFPQDDPEWVLPCRIAPFDSFVRFLLRFDNSEPDDESPAILTWTGCRRALPPVPLTDPRCPTLALIGALKQQGWEKSEGTVVHTALLPTGGHAPYDGRLAVKHKFYYQVLLQLSKTLPLAGGTVPSQQPQAFYKLLLRGERAVPYLGNKHYVVKWNQGKDIHKKELLPITDQPEGEPIQDGDNFYGDSVDIVLPKKKPRSHVRGSGGGGGRGGHRGGGAVDPPPLVDRPRSPSPPPEPTHGSGGGGSGSGGEGGGHGGEHFYGPPEDQEHRFDKGVEAIGPGGVKVRFTPYISPEGKYQPNWTLKCTYHQGCNKRRGATQAFEKHHGVIEPPAFLFCWHEVRWPTDPSKLTHAQENPTQESVDRYVEAHAEEMKEICREVGR